MSVYYDNDNGHVNVSMSFYLLAKHLRTNVKDQAKHANVLEIQISHEEALYKVPVNLYNHLAWFIFDTPDILCEDGKSTSQ